MHYIDRITVDRIFAIHRELHFITHPHIRQIQSAYMTDAGKFRDVVERTRRIGEIRDQGKTVARQRRPGVPEESQI